jgi:hypothetical protein
MGVREKCPGQRSTVSLTPALSRWGREKNPVKPVAAGVIKLATRQGFL